MKTIAVMVLTVLTVGFLTSAAAQELNASTNLQTDQSPGSSVQAGSMPRVSSIWRSLSSLGYVGSNGGSSSNVTTAAQPSNTTMNWSGYDSTGRSYTSISGSWTVPNATTPSGETSADAAWVGIGGVTTQDLIQVGTQNIISPDGQVATSAFYEMLPDVSQSISNMTINSGDSITASISEVSDGRWLITLKDNTNGQSYVNTVAYDSSLSSAEWVEEDPSDGASEIPLDDFGTITFTKGSTTENGDVVSITGSQAQAVSMMNQAGQTLASASSVGSNGSSFSVTRTSASSVPEISQFNEFPDSWTRRGDGINWSQQTIPSRN